MISNIIEENPEQLLTSLAIISISYLLFTFIIYPLNFHPLSKIPGPRICALSKYFILYKSWSEQRNRYVQKLHEDYGSIVRIGPNEIDISDVDYLKDIYINDFDKTSFYTQFINYDSANTFSTTDKKTHKESRKVSHKFYSKSSICSENVQSKITKVMARTLEVIDDNKSKPIDVFILFSEMAMDTVTAFSFGSNNYISVLKDPFKNDRNIIDDFLKQSSAWFFTTSLPQWYNFFVSKSVLQSSKRCYDWIEKQFNDSLLIINETREKNEETLLTVLLDQTRSSIFTELRAKSEFFDHIAAGHNTTATTLSYLFLRLAENSEIQNRLEKELFEFNNNKKFSSSNYSPALHSKVDEVDALPYMHAVINETFRLHAAIPGQEPRVVPSKGLDWRGSKESPECKIPGGVTVTMQPWSLHRVETVFPDHEKFDPDRWLDSDEIRLKKMKKHMMHFGSGARMCIGMHLATAEIKVILASVMSRYKVSLVDRWDYAHDGEMLDIYTTAPRSESMMLLFTEL